MRVPYAIVLLAAASLPARQLNPIPPADKDPFVGEWQANATKSRPKLSSKEATYRRTFRREGEDLVLKSSGGKQKGAGPSVFHSDGLRGYWTREVNTDGKAMTLYEYRDRSHKAVASVMVMDRLK